MAASRISDSGTSAGLFERCFGFLETLAAVEKVSLGVGVGRVVRRERHRALDVLEGLLDPSTGGVEHAERVPNGRVLRARARGLLEHLERLQATTLFHERTGFLHRILGESAP